MAEEDPRGNGARGVDWAVLYYYDVFDNLAVVLFFSPLLPKSALVPL